MTATSADRNRASELVARFSRRWFDAEEKGMQRLGATFDLHDLDLVIRGLRKLAEGK